MTYMRLVRFTLTPATASQAEIIGNDLVPTIKQQPGCLSATFLGGGADGECGLCVHWDSRENADAASAIIGPRLERHLQDNVVAPPDIHLFPVLIA